MKPLIQILLGAAVAANPVLASTPVAPPVAAVSSSALEVHQPQLKFEDGAWRLSGCVAPRRGSQPALATHLDLVCLDSSGAPVAIEVVPLKASTLRFRPRARRPHVRFTLPDGFVVPSTARIEVRAHDEAHPEP